jgi:hypothetical protein
MLVQEVASGWAVWDSDPIEKIFTYTHTGDSFQKTHSLTNLRIQTNLTNLTNLGFQRNLTNLGI